MAPYCAIPRDYLSDTPLLRAMGFLVSQHGQLGAIPPPPFLSISPLESMRSGGAIHPRKGGISAILARYPMKTRQMGAIPPSAILSQKGIAGYGGVSRIGPLSRFLKNGSGSSSSALFPLSISGNGSDGSGSGSRSVPGPVNLSCRHVGQKESGVSGRQPRNTHP